MDGKRSEGLEKARTKWPLCYDCFCSRSLNRARRFWGRFPQIFRPLPARRISGLFAVEKAGGFLSQGYLLPMRRVVFRPSPKQFPESHHFEQIWRVFPEPYIDPISTPYRPYICSIALSFSVLLLGDATGACKSISDFLTLIIIIIINIVQFQVSLSFIVFSPPVISGIHTSQIETRFPFHAKTGFPQYSAPSQLAFWLANYLGK